MSSDAILVSILILADWLAVLYLVLEARHSHLYGEGALKYRIASNVVLSLLVTMIGLFGASLAVIAFIASLPVLGWPVARLLGLFR